MFDAFSRRSRAPYRRRATGASTRTVALVTAASLSVIAGATGCGDNTEHNQLSHSAPTTPAPGAMPQQWRDAVADIERRYGGEVGISLAVPGAGLDSSAPKVEHAGSVQDGVAWSTSKVPLAVATVRRTHEVTDAVENAITISDNDSASALWNDLGGWGYSGEAMDEVLRDGGDSTTTFGSAQKLGNLPFGEVPWRVDDQAAFGANLLCISGGELVSQVMAHIHPEHAYGLGRIEGARFKGGWSPEDTGYFMRQFGIIPDSAVAPTTTKTTRSTASTVRTAPATPDPLADPDYDNTDPPSSFVGVAIAVRPADGSYTTGVKMLNELADAIAAHPATGGSCR
ncbi:hypothetical protein KRX51_00595 [Corynebacterium sp. TAE3-ERU12]|uniref:hypothetical protein n=1 Tax=Corynebacterium sp. TAE3-ERU12 TaxID=2849491 RepID=UPI001C440495|nr:hypothetical protein [Corynebacterium sp. TAE3-ERU12]MBV7294422.1 hypothetical protein [Corynebacterium sp. TAE3-ERU12]